MPGLFYILKYFLNLTFKYVQIRNHSKLTKNRKKIKPETSGKNPSVNQEAPAATIVSFPTFYNETSKKNCVADYFHLSFHLPLNFQLT
jgi:hypothetical protein